MSVQAITWAMQVAAGSATRKLVLLTLANFANESGEAYPTYETLVRVTELNRKTVASVLAGLEADGLICDTGDRRGTTRQVVVYRLGMAPSDRVEVPKSRRATVPKTEPLKSTENGTVNSTENGTVPKTEQYRFYQETVPFLDGKSTENGTQNHQGTVKGTVSSTPLPPTPSEPVGPGGPGASESAPKRRQRVDPDAAGRALVMAFRAVRHPNATGPLSKTQWDAYSRMARAMAADGITPEQVADTIGMALQFVPKKHLIACTNCGLAPMDRAVAEAKLRALAEGARLAARRYG